MKVVVSGASGVVGSAVVSALQRGGDTVIRLVRGNPAGTDEVPWDPESGRLDTKAIEGVDGVVHLAGENIASGRWSPERKRRILESRVKGTRLLCETVTRLARPPRVLLCASAVGYYGDRGDEILTESSSPGQGFLADVCIAWERATKSLQGTTIRTVRMRLGVVLSTSGGALRAMLPAFRFGLGGVIGTGRQYMSWISIDDLVSAIDHCLRNESCDGAFNMTSPNPATNRELTKSLGRVLGRPTVLPLPSFAARLALGQMADELLLSSQRAQPKRLLEGGFSFRHVEIEETLKRLVGKV